MINFSQLGRILGIDGKKIYDWYKDYLSGFRNKETQQDLHKNDITDFDVFDKKTGKFKQILVPIFKPENFGKNMCMDDKNMGDKGYLIFSNTDTKKIALVIGTTKLKLIKQIIHKLPVEIQFAVETMTRDLGSGYYWFCKEVFPRLREQIADKFHIIKDALTSLQDIRVRYRQAELSKKRAAYEAHKQSETKRKNECKKLKKPFVKKKFRYKEDKLSNGETLLQLLAKSRYLLFKLPQQWYYEQKERARILFEKYPEIERAYKLICTFRSFYSIKIGSKNKAIKALRNWFGRVQIQDIEEISNFSSMVERHYTEIMNYFNEGRTNAYAEGLNSKLERIIQTNMGIKDRNFFHYRIKNYFS